MEIRGSFSTYELSTLEKDVFAEYLQHSMNNPALEFIRYLLGDDYIKFIDVMSGTTIKIPSSKSLGRDLESVKIYLYIKRHGFTELSIKEAAKSYGKSVLTTRRYALKVSKVLGVEDMLEGDDLNNYITYIKSVEDLDSYYLTKAEAKQEQLREERKKAEGNTDNEECDIKETVLDDKQDEVINYDNELNNEELKDIIDDIDVGDTNTEIINENDVNKFEVQDVPKVQDESEDVKDFWNTYCDKPWVSYLHSKVQNLKYDKEVVYVKSGTYLRLLNKDNSPVASIFISPRTIAIDLYFTSVENKLKAQSELCDLSIKEYCKSAFTVKNVVDNVVIDRVINIIRREHLNGQNR